jgi:hypothetical protein
MGGKEGTLPPVDTGVLCAFRQRLNQERADPVSLPVINDCHGDFGEISKIGVAEAPGYTDEIDFTLSFVQHRENQRKMLQSVRLGESDHLLS